MRASRLVSLLLLLQTRGRMTAAQLADVLEVSVRTIYRDLEALSAAGVPVYAEAGPNGGAQLLDGYRTRLTGLTAKEAEALFVSGVPGPVGQLGLGTVLGAAQLKLLAALPKDLADRATVARQRFHLDAPQWYRAGRNERHLAEVASAVWEDRRITICYRHPGGDDPVTRQLEPYGLVLKAGVWYLVARRDGELRTYRLSRIEAVTVLAESFDRPVDFDLADHWGKSVAQYEARPLGQEVVVQATPRGVEHLARLERDGPLAITEKGEVTDGWARCVVAFESLDDAFVDLLRVGTDVEVLEPASLRARVAETADALAALYRSSTGRS